MTKKIAVVGGGIIGSATAYELKKADPTLDVQLFEKESSIGSHQTGHNSGVVHAGLYYTPGSNKAKFCRRGVNKLKSFCADHGLRYEELGKLVVAQGSEETELLKDVFERSTANEVPGVRWLQTDEITELEPNVQGDAALLSPGTAIIDFSAVAKKLAEQAEQAGATISLGKEVLDITTHATGVLVSTNRDEHQFDHVVICAGLQSDRIARRAGDAKYPIIVPFFGSYYLLNEHDSGLVSRAIYPVPDPKYPFLGVHITPRLDGRMMIGPNAYLSFAREKYGRMGTSVGDLSSMATHLGFWKMAMRNMGQAAKLLPEVLGPGGLLSGAKELVPRIEGTGVTSLTRGIRAQAVSSQGELEDDFVLHSEDRLTILRNAPSPGATSALALGEELARLALGKE
ncbi:L-2-hydroxyglutarate oxidase [Nesterenkonia flava]|uniref:L-2-hydroxyglutarate oxidase n=1 Tax=Nesterenkonia flava TaxID=469799 RepID=A0ABU1FWL2_9MICC|nr:L-2-hydroxyglutarate oxidase [Nesterenkonia flava]MDR5713074.1 L-2-hydroxyglutarate oxidase [Nesterenkonia flava]